MAQNKLLHKNPEVDLRLKYQKWMEGALIAALILTMSLFYAFKRFESTKTLKKVVDKDIEQIEIPPTQQLQKPLPPAKPKIPIESGVSFEIVTEVKSNLVRQMSFGQSFKLR